MKMFVMKGRRYETLRTFALGGVLKLCKAFVLGVLSHTKALFCRVQTLFAEAKLSSCEVFSVLRCFFDFT